jgi:hypothetical protein
MKKIILTESQLKKIIQMEQENHISQDGTYMVLSNLIQMKNDIEKILNFKHMPDFPKLVTGEHAWAGDHITTSKDDIEEVANFMEGYFEQKNLSESEKDLSEKCWDGYKRIGSKKKNGKTVPNCVPISEASSPAQQAAIAVNMKKKGVEPKNLSEKEMYEAMEIDESKNTPTNPTLWASSLAWARSKYDVCPSAYCNGAAAKHYKSKGGGWRKSKK